MLQQKALLTAETAKRILNIGYSIRLFNTDVYRSHKCFSSQLSSQSNVDKRRAKQINRPANSRRSCRHFSSRQQTKGLKRGEEKIPARERIAVVLVIVSLLTRQQEVIVISGRMHSKR